MSLEVHGFSHVPSSIPRETLEVLRNTLFEEVIAGERCLLDHPAVREIAIKLKRELIESGHLPSTAVAIQAIAFDKTPATNWKVAWHQDLMFPFAKCVISDGFEIPSIKQGIDYARPPAGILGELLAARLHLDDCDATIGPLRVSPGTHRLGILGTCDIPAQVADHGHVTCVAKTGEVLLMRPLILHASSQATEPKHRRILHLVYHSGAPVPETWYRTI
jgi:ectoine hydroxylase-related dioxygenase (phytanoyl-CoA dioxygenase family)